MKALKITILGLLVLNIAMPIFQSCTKDSSKADNPIHPFTLENLVDAYNKDVVIEHYKAIFMEGEMTITTLPSKEVLFFLKKAGAKTNEIFLGQGTELSSVIHKALGKAKVAYLREALAVETAAGEIYTFTIGERKGHELVQKLVPTWSGKGYGLAYNYSRLLSPSDYKGLSSTDELGLRGASTCKCENSSTVTPSSCNSGGAGATSCSIGATVQNGNTVDPGCSVSCSTNQFACCMNYSG